MATPTVVQHVSSSANPVGVGIAGNGFILKLPNAVQAGNCLVLSMTWQNSRTVSSISDTINGTWGAVLKQVTGGTGNYKSAIYAFPNAGAGITQITITFSGTTTPFQGDVTEYNNINASPSNGSAGSANVSGSATLQAGSFTPGNNDANGGNLIHVYSCIGSTAGSNPTSWVPDTGATLLNGCIAWVSNQGVPHGSEYYIQTTSTAINPTITATADTVDGFNTVAVALKVASAGAGIPAGIHVNKIIHETQNVATSTWALQFPATGNLRYFACTTPGWTSVTDSDGNTWTQVATTLFQGVAFYCANQSASPTLIITLHGPGIATSSVRLFDIQGADTSPYDTFAEVAPTAANSVTSVAHQPDITPSTSNGLVIATLQIGNGPGTAITSPTGGIFDLWHYTSETDLDLMENADGTAHLYNSSTAAENWTWTITSRTSDSVSSVAVAFKAPAGGGSSFISAWAQGSNLPVLGTGTY